MKRVAATFATLAVFAVVALSGDRALFSAPPARPHVSAVSFLAPTPLQPGPMMSGSRAPVVVPTGRGDKRTKKGKRFAGSFGNSRPRNSELWKKKQERQAEPKSEQRQVADFAVLGGLTGIFFAL